jgi:hypothetical protein
MTHVLDNAPALSAMFKQIIANNRSGGWQPLRRLAQVGPRLMGKRTAAP